MQHIAVHVTLYLKNFRRYGPGEFLLVSLELKEGVLSVSLYLLQKKYSR